MMVNFILFLNDFGTGELFFIMIAVLMLFGAKSIPSIAKNLGRGIREIKTASDEIKRDIQKSAFDMKRDMNMPDMDVLKDIKKPLETIKNPIKEIGESILETPKVVDEYDSNSKKSE